MKALILAGGYGTRLRPLTLSKPKPLVEFANKPILWHQVKALVEVGVTEIILAINYQPECMLEYMKQLEAEFSIKVTASIETEPLGTAGPIRLAKDKLLSGSEQDDFFVFNSDIICQFPLKKLLEFHRARKAEGTIMVTQVEDPTRYGVILYDENGQIQQFIEKPSKPVSDKINAGLYILNKSVIERIPDCPTSIERVIFPKIVADHKLYALILEGIWYIRVPYRKNRMDIGQPADFIKAGDLYLNYLVKTHEENLAKGENIVGTALVDSSAKLAKTAKIGPNVVIGPGCCIGEGCRIKNACIMAGSVIGSSAYIADALIGWGSKVGNWCRIEGTAVLGEDVVIKDELHVNGAIVLPHKAIGESVRTPGTVLL